MMNATLRSIVLATAATLASHLAVGAESPAAKPKFTPLQILAQPPAIKPGAPLSARAMVTHPPALRGVQSWTIDSRRHRGAMYSLAPSPNGQLMATCGIDGSVRIWKVPEGKLVRALVGHDSYTYGVAWSPCGTALASAGSWDGTVRIWEPKSGRTLRVFKGLKTPVTHVAWSPDGLRVVAACGPSGAIWLWNTKTDETETLLEVGRYAGPLVWSPDAKQLAVCASQSPVTILDVDSNKPSKSLGLGMGNEIITNVAWSPDSKLLASGCAVNCTIWDADSAKEVKKLAGACVSAAWSPDGKQLAAATGGYAVQLWDVASAKVTDKVPCVASKLIWHPDSETLVCGYSLNFAVWNPADKKVVCTVDAAGQEPPYWMLNRPIVLGVQTSTLSLWDSTSCKFLKELKGHTSTVSSVAWSRDGKALASASYDKTIRVWNTASGETERKLEGHTAAVAAVAWSPSGKTLASAGYDNAVRLWDPDKESSQTLEGHTGPVRAVAWSPLGNLLASGSNDATVIVWDAKLQKLQRTIKVFQPVQALACTTISKTMTLACGTTDEVVQVINATTGAQMVNLRLRGSPPNVTGLVWLPNGGMLLSGRGNHSVQLWDVGKEKVVHNLHTMAPVSYVTLAGNGSILVAGNYERSVRFWDAGSGDLRGVLLAENDHVSMVGFDGHWKADPDKTPELVYVVQTAEGQVTLPPDEFAAKFHWRNNPARVKLAVGGR